MAVEFLASSIIPGREIEHHEHRLLLTVLVGIVVLAIIIFFLIRFGTFQTEQPSIPVPANDSIAIKRAQLNVPNPSVNLSAQDITIKKAQLAIPNSTVKLSAQSIAIKKEQLARPNPSVRLSEQ